ncbi:MAG TPA: hypothetical protein VGN26_23305 [Armatimonadota bacterium]|jgi:hypothetical protein
MRSSHAWKCASTLAVLWCSLCSPARATYSGLTLIPTADTVGAGQYGLELQSDGSASTLSPDTYLLNSQFGFGSRFEAGTDLDLSPGANPVFLWNAKWVAARSNKRDLGLALGVMNVGKGTMPTRYAVLSKGWSALRGHVGALKGECAGRWFLGLDRPVTTKATLMADYTSGRESFWSLGVAYQSSPSTGWVLGAQVPNGGGSVGFTLHLCLNGAYRAPRRSPVAEAGRSGARGTQASQPTVAASLSAGQSGSRGAGG